MSSRARLLTIAGSACLVTVAALAACAVGRSSGADFGYPDEPPAPPGASVVATAKGWDDDDPMRGLEAVLDIGSIPVDRLLAFYREQFPTSDGWREGTPDADVGGGHLLCLVNHADERFDEYVEIYPYRGHGSESAGPHRYLASVSRLVAGSGSGERSIDRCGLAGIWFPDDLELARPPS